jgi:hypothetical protein
MTYKGTAPIFITTKLKDLENLDYQAGINPATNEPWDSEASMLRRRLKIYKFETRIPKPASDISFCARCFANMVLTQAAKFAG